MTKIRGSLIYSTDVLEEFRKAMGDETAEGDDQMGFRLKVTALERFLNHGLSRFSLQDWHLALTSLFQSYQQGIAERPDHRGITKVMSVAQLRLISHDLLLQNRSLRGVATHALKYLDNFLAALKYLKEAKESVDVLFQFLYQSYYDPSDKQDSLGKDLSITTSHNLSCDLESHPHLSPVEDKFHHALSPQYGIQTPEQMSGNAAHKLDLTVVEMKDIMARWARLQEEEAISSDDLDPESQQDLLLLQGTSAFEPVLRLMPDIFAKFYKCLELAKQWWSLAHKIYPVLPRHHASCQAAFASTAGKPEDDGRAAACKPAVAGALEAVSKENVALQEQLVSVNKDILNAENMLLSYRHDLQLLTNRERHFESLVETYERVSTEMDDKTRERRALGAVREGDVGPASADIIAMSNGKSDRTSEEKLQSATEENCDKQLLDSLDREIQLLQFQQALLLQDYLVQLELRPSLIRFADDLRMKTCEAERHLADKSAEKHHLQQRMMTDEQGENRLVTSSHVRLMTELSDIISNHDFGMSGKDNYYEEPENRRMEEKQDRGDSAIEETCEAAGFQIQPVQDKTRADAKNSNPARTVNRPKRRTSLPSVPYQGFQCGLPLVVPTAKLQDFRETSHLLRRPSKALPPSSRKVLKEDNGVSLLPTIARNKSDAMGFDNKGEQPATTGKF